MDELTYVYGTILLIVGAFAIQVLTRKFDPFAPIWLFLVGYTQVYVIQPLSYHEWAIGARGVEVVTAANFRAFWALAWFMGVYYLGPGKLLAKVLPRAPGRWSMAPVNVISPVLIVWGLYCAGLVLQGSHEDGPTSAETALILSFPLVLLVGGVVLIVTGRQPDRPRPAYTVAGVSIVVLYMLVWMFHGKRSHALVAILAGICSFYIPRARRPSFPVLVATAIAGVMAVGIAIGWRFYANQSNSYGSVSKFINFVSTFDPATALESINLKEKVGRDGLPITYETEEYGGFLLMMDTVPMKSDYDYGANYLRVFSTFIPRIVWLDKPIYGRDQWIAAWVAGSEVKREANFTGPAIGILGATQLNGGATGTVIVLGVVALLLSTTYWYFRLHAGSPWVQVWWPLWYYNAWFMTVNDDPCNWFYYNFGFTTMPALILFWFANKSGGVERG
jgi:hypothetical protein